MYKKLLKKKKFHP